MKRSNATRKLATQRRKLSEELLAFNKKHHQFFMDKMYGTISAALKSQKNTSKMNKKSSKMNKIIMKTLDMDRLAKQVSMQFIINQNVKHLPPMSAEQESQLIQQLKVTLNKVHENLKQMKTDKSVKAVQYDNPYPFKPTAMPNLYSATSDCAWESDDVGNLYAKRQAAIKAFYTMLEKNTKFLGELKTGKMSELFALVDKNMMLMKSLPPGPNKKSEQERIEYLEISKDIVEDTLIFLNYVMYEMKKLFSQLKKDMAKK